MTIRMELAERAYDIVLENGALLRAGELLNLQRRVFIVTDDGVPEQYVRTVAAMCTVPHIFSVPQGEDSKSFAMLEKALAKMLEAGFTRSDCVVAVGGGVVGDLAGFTASCYMRGIDFYNIPTTVLAQADSSIGGKTAINLNGVKNTVGAFYQPAKVLIDPDTVQTLSPRQKACGFAEIIKTGLIADNRLFEAFEERGADVSPEEVTAAALHVKKKVVEEDEREGGRRKILNFGHTIGHGIESVTDLMHGECVALGMLPMCALPVRARLAAVMTRLNLPTEVRADRSAVYEALLHDKKRSGETITVVQVETPGSCVLRGIQPETLKTAIETVVKP